MGVCNCSIFCCMLLYVHSSIAIILMGKRELVALLNLSSWCLVKVERLFLAVPQGCLRFVIVVFPDHTHLLFVDPGLQTEILFDLFHIYCCSACMQNFSINISNCLSYSSDPINTDWSLTYREMYILEIRCRG